MAGVFRSWTAGGIAWRAEPADAERLGPLLDAEDPRTGTGRWRTVQENLHRAVRESSDPAPGAFLKAVRPAGVRQRLRDLFLGNQAWREWNAAQALHGRRIPIPRPLAVGRAPGGQGLYLCEAIPGARDAARLAAATPPRDRPALLARLGAFVARLHDAGVSHADLHAGNLLVGTDGTVLLVDLVAARVRRRLGAIRRAREIGILVASLGDLSGPDRLRILAAYLANLRGAPAVRGRLARTRMVRRAFAAARRAVRRHWASRTRKSLRRSSSFRRARNDRWRAIWRTDAGTDLDSLRRLVEEHRETLRTDRARVRKDAPETAVTAGHRLGGAPACVKAYRPRGAGDRLLGLVRPGRARRAWRAANGLAIRRVPVPRPLAVVRDGRAGHLLSEEIVGARQLDTLLAERGPAWAGGPEGTALGEAVAGLLRAGFRAGVRFGDLKGCNLLARCDPDGAWRVWLTDVDGTRFPRCLGRMARLRPLVQLNTSIPAAVPIRARLKVLRAALRGRPRRILCWYARAAAQVSLGRPVVYVGPSGDVRER